jgi:hypothetical protein
VIAACLLAGCARSEKVPEQREDGNAVQPAAPVAAADVEASSAEPEKPAAASWRLATGAEETRLEASVGGSEPGLILACAETPRELVARVPGFTRIDSEDRFMLGMGSAPIVLVADLTKERQGVEARAPVPMNFAAQMDAANTVSALYGTQQFGPVTAPSGVLKRALLASCGTPAGNAEVPPEVPQP